MESPLETFSPATSASWLICQRCGTQFPTSDRYEVKTCHICDDLRSSVPPSGQTFTTHSEIAKGCQNDFVTYAANPNILSIVTRPKVAIGQRAILIRTPTGNILWDCVTLLDESTISRIEELGGLKAIVISHPHYFTTHTQWGRAFRCPVYLALEDKVWTTMESSHQVFLANEETTIEGTGAVAIKLGGHFPGPMVLLYERRLFIADTLCTTPAGIGKWEVDGTGALRQKPQGLNTFSFMWSIPNLIPLGADEMLRMWKILKKHDFTATHGAFVHEDIEDEHVKRRVLESMQIQAKFMGNNEHAIVNESIYL